MKIIKKVFMIAVMMVSLGIFTNMGSAQDVYICSGKGADIYVEDNTITPISSTEFSVYIKQGHGEDFKEVKYNFFLNTSNVWCYTTDYSSTPDPVYIRKEVQSIFNFCQKYL